MDPARNLSSSPAERRKFRRIKCQCAAEVHQRDDDDEVILSYVVELSAGGCFVRANRAVPAGTLLTLDLALEDRRRILVQGVVLYSGPASRGSAEPGSHGFAVGFTMMEREARRALHAFLGDAAPSAVQPRPAAKPPARRARAVSHAGGLAHAGTNGKAKANGSAKANGEARANGSGSANGKTKPKRPAARPRGRSH